MADSFTLGFVFTAIMVLRIIMMPFLLYNIAWSFKSFVQFIRGQNFPACLYETMVFFMCTGLAGYNILVFLGRQASPWSHPYSLVLQCIFFLAVLIATLGKRIALTNNFETFYWLLSKDNLNVAVRAAHLNELDSEYTNETLELAETSLAVRLARKALDGDSG